MNQLLTRPFSTTVNLEEELLAINSSQAETERRMVGSAQEILNRANEKDVALLESAGLATHYKQVAGIQAKQNIYTQVPDAKRVFRIEQIEKLCIRYGLRFLSSKRFKGPIPYEVIAELKKHSSFFDKTLAGTGTSLKERLRIAAPASAFHLDPDIEPVDPLLFFDLGEGLWYLVHKWGSDISWWRKVIVWPIRSFPIFLLWTFPFMLYAFAHLPWRAGTSGVFSVMVVVIGSAIWASIGNNVTLAQRWNSNRQASFGSDDGFMDDSLY